MFVIFKVIFIGVGATLMMDMWALLLKQFNIKSLDFRLVGRWIGNFPKGKFYHTNIIDTPSIRNELFIGWSTHYLIGISFAFLLVGMYGKEWLEKPNILPPIIIGLITIVAPFFIMQPALGFGVASSKLPKPNKFRFKSLITHLVYGLGLYLSTILLNMIIE